MGVLAVGEHPRVGAEGNLDPRRDRFAQTRARQRQHGLRLLAHQRRQHREVDPVDQVRRRHQIGSLLLHQCDCFVIQHRAVLDRGHPGPHRRLDPLGAVGVRGHFDPVARGLVHDRLELFEAELLRPDRSLHREHARRRADLDDLRTVLDLVAHRLDRLPGAIGDAVLGAALQDPRREAGDITMPAGDADQVTRRYHPRADHGAPRHRLAKRHGDVAAEVAHRGESGAHRLERVGHRGVGAVGVGERHWLGEEGRRDLAGEVDVEVDEAGQQRHVAQIHGAGARGERGGSGIHRSDPVALNHHCCIGEHAAARHVEHAGGADDDRLRVLRRQSLRREAESGEEDQSSAHGELVVGEGKSNVLGDLF